MKYDRTQIKNRVRQLKSFLPHNLRNKILELHPEYNTEQGKTLIDNVLTYKSADYRLMEILEKIANTKTL